MSFNQYPDIASLLAVAREMRLLDVRRDEAFRLREFDLQNVQHLGEKTPLGLHNYSCS